MVARKVGSKRSVMYPLAWRQSVRPMSHSLSVNACCQLLAARLGAKRGGPRLNHLPENPATHPHTRPHISRRTADLCLGFFLFLWSALPSFHIIGPVLSSVLSLSSPLPLLHTVSYLCFYSAKFTCIVPLENEYKKK